MTPLLQQLMSYLHPVIPWELAVVCLLVIAVVVIYEGPRMRKG